MQLLICTKCRESKPSDHFSLDARKVRRLGRQCHCKACGAKAARSWRTRNREHCTKIRKRWESAHPQRHLSKYGITLADKQRIFKNQGEVCAACGSNQHGSPKHTGDGWCLDHDHTTKQVRGVLCWSCNMALGHSRESIARLKGIIAYLEHNAAINTLIAGAGLAHEGYADCVASETSAARGDHQVCRIEPAL